jgi:hypothetical protein
VEGRGATGGVKERAAEGDEAEEAMAAGQGTGGRRRWAERVERGETGERRRRGWCKAETSRAAGRGGGSGEKPPD